ncbi:MAG: PIN domain-containing protein [Caldilineae bacterium]|nr:MAG: PIN domain-containing protein [Caldilineae bacterium]
MDIFVDTSGIIALMNADDRFHPAAVALWHQWIDEQPQLITSNYVIVETVALLQRRIGMESVRAFYQNILPVIRVEWIAEETHQAAVTALLTAGRRAISLVDCTSFELMQALRLRTVFTFDHHFAGQGFLCLPQSG